MQAAPSPVFGKRNVGRPEAARPIDLGPTDHAAVFASIRAELDETADARPRRVPRSFRAAFLAGLVVGCALAGFDVTGRDGTDRIAPLAGILGVEIDTTNLLPAMILLGLLGGARAAATTMILVHSVLARIGRSEPEAYAIGGALATAALSGALLLGLGHPPAHGWPIELLAGAGAGLLYRIFAGSHAASS